MSECLGCKRKEERGIKEKDEECFCRKCPECGSTDTEAYDDGEGYPMNIECKTCEHWWDD